MVSGDRFKIFIPHSALRKNISKATLQRCAPRVATQQHFFRECDRVSMRHPRAVRWGCAPRMEAVARSGSTKPAARPCARPKPKHRSARWRTAFSSTRLGRRQRSLRPLRLCPRLRQPRRINSRTRRPSHRSRQLRPFRRLHHRCSTFTSFQDLHHHRARPHPRMSSRARLFSTA